MKSMLMDKKPKDGMLKDVTFEENSEDFNSGDMAEKEQPEYHYGLRICLNNEVLKKLGYEKLPEVGTKLKLNAMVEVCSKNESESVEYGKNMSMDLQITDMELGKEKPDPSVKLYNAENVVKEE